MNTTGWYCTNCLREIAPDDDDVEAWLLHGACFECWAAGCETVKATDVLSVEDELELAAILRRRERERA